MDVTLKLSAEEAKAILNVLGQLPTNSGAYPLMVKVGEQFEAQTNPTAASKLPSPVPSACTALLNPNEDS